MTGTARERPPTARAKDLPGIIRTTGILAAMCLLPAHVWSAPALGAQEPLTIPLSGPGTSATGPTFARPLEVVHLSDGRLLVNDPGARRVVLLDSTLATGVAVIDSAAVGPTRSYGPRLGRILAYQGDSSFFFDAASLSFVVLDPDGRVARVMASPIPATLVLGIMQSTFSTAVYSPERGMLYTGLKPQINPVTSFIPGSVVHRDDSSAVLVARFETRVLDTITAIKRGEFSGRATPAGTVIFRAATFPTLDEWSGFRDGTIAVVRGRDLRIELFAPDNSRRVLPRISFAWQRLDDDRKQQIADSMTVAEYSSLRAGSERVLNDPNAPPPARTRATAALAALDSVASRGGVVDASVPVPSTAFRLPDPYDPEALPDFLPVFRQGGVKGDVDGNVWIQIAPPNPGSPNTYLVVTREGVASRVVVPEGANLIGFGPGGIVYLTAFDGGTAKVIRSRWK